MVRLPQSPGPQDPQPKALVLNQLPHWAWVLMSWVHLVTVWKASLSEYRSLGLELQPDLHNLRKTVQLFPFPVAGWEL